MQTPAPTPMRVWLHTRGAANARRGQYGPERRVRGHMKEWSVAMEGPIWRCRCDPGHAHAHTHAPTRARARAHALLHKHTCKTVGMTFSPSLSFTLFSSLFPLSLPRTRSLGSNNRIGDDGATYLSASLACLTSMQMLNIG